MNSNAESIVLYQHLIDDCDNSVLYWNGQADSDEKTTNIKNYTELKSAHEKNVARLMEQSKARGENLIETIEEYIERVEKIILVFGAWLPLGVKEWYTKLIKTAKKLLEIFKKL